MKTERMMIIQALAKARNYLSDVKGRIPHDVQSLQMLVLDDIESAVEESLTAYHEIVNVLIQKPENVDELLERVKTFEKDIEAFEFFDDVIDAPSRSSTKRKKKKAPEESGELDEHGADDELPA